MNDMTNGGALTVSRQGFGVAETQGGAIDTAAVAFAAEAKALVEARFIMAMRRPRNWDDVRQELLRECRRPSFAHNKSAYYKKPIGEGVEGLGIRFVEVALRCITNVSVETRMKSEDELKEVHSVSITDLETTVFYSQEIRVSKTVERSKPASDGSYISVRKNSWNKDVYTLPATDDDLLNKRAALISKAVRTLGLRIIPGDLQDEGEETIKRIRLDKAAQDPDGERKSIVDAFDVLNIRASDLGAYLGCPLDQCSPAQLVDLRGLYGAIKDGEATWKSVMDAKSEASRGVDAPPPANRPAPKKKEKPAAPTAGTADAPTAETPPAPPADDAHSLATEGEKAYLVKKATEAGMTIERLAEETGITNFAGLSPDGFIAMKEKLAEFVGSQG